MSLEREEGGPIGGGGVAAPVDNHQHHHNSSSNNNNDNNASSSTSASPVRSSSAGSKMMAVRVQMLDDSITLFQVQTKAPGRILFDQVCKQLNLLEVDYFGLEYQDTQHRVTVRKTKTTFLSVYRFVMQTWVLFALNFCIIMCKC